MALEWGVTPLAHPENADVESSGPRARRGAREPASSSAGDRVVITAGTAVNIAGSTNVIKVEVA